MIELSIIVPCYNKKEYISNTLNSIIKYHYINDNKFECILVDEESTDGTTDILIEYAKKYSYFKYVRILNDGIPKPSNARNFGLTVASGKYVLFIDADDELSEENFIPVGIEYLNNHSDIDIYINNAYFVREAQSFICYLDIVPNEKNIRGPILFQCIIKKESIQNLKFYNTYGEDQVFTYKLFYCLNLKYYFTNENNTFIYNAYTNYMVLNEEKNGFSKYQTWKQNIVNELQYYNKYNYCLDSNQNIIDKNNKPINNIDIHIIDKCNLNCKYCNHYAPLVKDDYEYPSFIKIKKDLLNLSRYSDYFRTLTILGGEPTLNHDLPEILDLAREILPNNEIRLITNGLNYKQLEKYSDKIINNKIIVDLSIYPIYNSNEILKTFKQIIPPELLIIDETPIKYGFGNLALSKNKNDINDDKLLHCSKRVDCLQLVDNKLYICHYLAYINILKEAFPNENINITNEDAYIELTENTTIDEILEFIQNKIPNSCHYCKYITQMNDNYEINFEFSSWEHSKKELEEFYN